MSWWGKLLGGTFGFMLGGPLGALIGAALGHNFDAGLRHSHSRSGDTLDFQGQERTQAAFFTATFSVMGHLAKSDGRVSQDEIRLANAVMDSWRLSPELKKAAQRLFNEGKNDDFPLDEVLEQLRVECHRRRDLIRVFLEIQMQAAFADGEFHVREKEMLEHVCQRLGLDTRELRHLEAMLRAELHRRTAGGAVQQFGLNLEDAYAVLDVDSQATDSEVKKAYRRMMNQHHPDKLVAKGLPEEMMKVATEKTQEIKAAYDKIKAERRH